MTEKDHRDREGPRAAVNACPPRDMRGGRETLHGRAADWDTGRSRETQRARDWGRIMIHDTGASSAAGKGVPMGKLRLDETCDAADTWVLACLTNDFWILSNKTARAVDCELVRLR